MIVVDASVAVKWFVAEADHRAADMVLSGDRAIIAPDRLLLEAANTLLRKTRRAEITHGQASAALRRLPSLLLEIAPSELIFSQAFELALVMDHQVYDCTYLALAVLRNCPMVTADKTFVVKAGLAGFSDRVVALSDWPD